MELRDWEIYETAKHRLQEQDLTPKEYEERIKELAESLGL